MRGWVYQSTEHDKPIHPYKEMKRVFCVLVYARSGICIDIPRLLSKPAYPEAFDGTSDNRRATRSCVVAFNSWIRANSVRRCSGQTSGNSASISSFVAAYTPHNTELLYNTPKYGVERTSRVFISYPLSTKASVKAWSSSHSSRRETTSFVGDVTAVLARTMQATKVSASIFIDDVI